MNEQLVKVSALASDTYFQKFELSRFKVSPWGFKSARTDDASFSNVCALADASSCKPANKSTI